MKKSSSNPGMLKKRAPMLWPGALIMLAGMATLLIIMVLFSRDYKGLYLERLFRAAVAGEHEPNPGKRTELPRDKFLGGLLPNSFDETSCVSRYEASMYWKVSHGQPSSYLVEKLRSYEALHKKCGPNTEVYNKSVDQLKSNSSKGPLECNYVVWKPDGGLGNLIMTITSSFVYALISNKVLLLHIPEDLQDLFCEPFPGTSWQLPSDFPIGNLTKNNWDITSNASIPAYVSLNMKHQYDKLSSLFFCNETQLVLQKVPWILIESNIYFLPSLFLNPNNDNELNQMFPRKELAFHYLSRYLIHPTNKVWGNIRRYHETYLANAKQKVSIQLRKYSQRPISDERMLARLLNCTVSESILPEVDLEAPFVPRKSSEQDTAVLVTYLNTFFSDKLRDLYYEHSSTTGELVSVFQPSHEEQQQFQVQNHHAKALSEMYLLSFGDVLVTSAWSTFGYVAQGLGGLRPWILFGRGGGPSCIRATSMEPCYHLPPTYVCNGKSIDMWSVVGHVRQCEDVSQGIKLFD